MTSLDPGKPLGPKDFWLGKQLQAQTANETTNRMMKLPQWRSDEKTMEELEALGEKYVKGNLNNRTRNILEPLK